MDRSGKTIYGIQKSLQLGLYQIDENSAWPYFKVSNEQPKNFFVNAFPPKNNL